MRKIKITPNKNKLKSKIETLKKKKTKAYIIGGGPSINPKMLPNLIDGDIIAVNKAIEYFPRVDFFVTIDYSFLSGKTNFSKLIKKADDTIFIVNKSNRYVVKKLDGFYYDTRFKLKYSLLKKINHIIESKIVTHQNFGFGLTYDQFANGENSGFCAIQLAILMGYQEINLLGFDLKIDGIKSHFHNGYANNTHFRKNLLKYQKLFDVGFSKLPVAVKSRIKSCSPKSYLNKYLERVNLPVTNSPSITERIKERLMTKNENVIVQTNCIDKRFKDLMVVGYFTINTPYEQEKEKLVKSIKKFGLPSYIKGIPNLGDWQKNTRYKAIFLKEMLIKFPDKKLLYIDADAEFLKAPDLFIDYNCDIAIRWQDFRWRKNESLSGTIYLENNSKTKLICERWIKYNDAEGTNPKTMEQWSLGKVIVEMRKTHNLNDNNLPNIYCSFDHIRAIYPDIKGKEVIVHYQASRRHRGAVLIKNQKK